MDIKKQIYIIISAFFLFLLFLALFFILPLFKEIKQNSKSLLLQKKNMIILSHQLKEAEKFKQKYENYQPDFHRIDSVFIDSSNPVGFIEFFENTAKNRNIKLQISAPQFSTEGGLTFASLQIFVSGDFPEVIKFIKEIESGPYLIQVQNLIIENRKIGKQGNEVATTAANISIKAFAR